MPQPLTNSSAKRSTRVRTKIRSTKPARSISSTISVPVRCRRKRHPFFKNSITVRTFKGRTPSQSSQSSHAEFETKEQMTVEMLRKTEGPPRNYSEAKKHVGCSLSAIQTSIPNSSFDFFFFEGPYSGWFSMHRVLKIRFSIRG